MKKLLKKKIFSVFIIIGFLLLQIPSALPALASADDALPDLPNLPDFDSVLPPDGADAFSPSSTPPKIAPKQPVNTTTQPVVKPAVSSPSKTVTAPVQKQYTSKPVNKPVSKPSNINKKPVNTANNSYYKNNKTSYIFPSGKKFKVISLTSISSNTPKGSRVSFKSLYPETSRYITIPAGTIFYGKVTDTHGPQFTGNGGLIVIEVNQMVYKGTAYDIDAKISVANGKHIFFNNIKGKRMYFQSIPKAMKPGTSYFKKMWRVTCKLARNDSGVEIILTPFSLLTGTVVYAVNFITSPVLAIFYKGKSISIPTNSQFTIQLREDAVLLK